MLKRRSQRRQKVSKPNFKFTLDDLNNMVIEALKEQPERPNAQGKPNLLQMLRTKKEQGKTE